jgi:protein Mpv17
MAGLLRIYNAALQRRPVLMTSLSTGVCYGLGDVVAQRVEMSQERRKEYDWRRVAIMASFGTIIAGPLYHAWFNKINEMPQFIERVVRVC